MSLDLADVRAKTTALQDELASMELKMLGLRKLIPAGGPAGKEAELQATRLATALADVELDANRIQASIDRAKAALEEEKKQFQDLEALSKL